MSTLWTLWVNLAEMGFRVGLRISSLEKTLQEQSGRRELASRGADSPGIA